jgi:hypothetical protein
VSTPFNARCRRRTWSQWLTVPWCSALRRPARKTRARCCRQSATTLCGVPDVVHTATDRQSWAQPAGLAPVGGGQAAAPKFDCRRREYIAVSKIFSIYLNIISFCVQQHIYACWYMIIFFQKISLQNIDVKFACFKIYEKIRVSLVALHERSQYIINILQ